MTILEYIAKYLESGGIIQVIPQGKSGLENQPIQRYWVENDNVIRLSLNG